MGKHEAYAFYPRLQALLLETKADWEFYDTLQSMLSTAKQGMILVINEGEAYAILSSCTWATGKTSLRCVWAHGVKITEHAVNVYRAMVSIAQQLGLDRVEIDACPRGEYMLRRAGLKNNYRTLYGDVTHA